MGIKLNDLLRLSEDEIARTKVRLNAEYDGEDAIDVYRRNPERVNCGGFLWRVKQNMFRVGNIGICLLMVRRDMWLLTTVKTITKDLGVMGGVAYEAEEVERLKPFFNRVMVRWHRTRKEQNQCVWLSKIMDALEVCSVLESEYDGDEFPGYDNVSLSYSQLAGILRYQKRDWVNALRGQKAVYLITDSATGKLYVGSATSDKGMLLDRWSAYVKSLHGGDVRLKELVALKGAEYVRRNFRYSILENFNGRVEDAVILRRESYWKEVLDTRRHGYNGN